LDVRLRQHLDARPGRRFFGASLEVQQRPPAVKMNSVR
jgi:hypothetical protein